MVLMKALIGILLYLPAILIRWVLILIGGFFAVPLSLVADGKYHTPAIWRFWAQIEHGSEMSENWTTWEKYKWFAWRNPTPGLKGIWKQPIPESKPNPDDKVRGPWSYERVPGAMMRAPLKSASRWMSHGLYWEFWWLREIDWGKYKWFEFRIGWKFVDGNDEFFPTFQLGPRSS